MSDFNLIASRLPGSPGAISAVAITGTVPDPPRNFAALDNGTILRGTVQGRDKDGLIAIKTDQGILKIATNANLQPGNNVTLEVRSVGDRLQVVVLAVDQGATLGQPAAAAEMADRAGPANAKGPPTGPTDSGQLTGTGAGAADRATRATSPAQSSPPPQSPVIVAGTRLTAIVIQSVPRDLIQKAGPPAPQPKQTSPLQPAAPASSASAGRASTLADFRPPVPPPLQASLLPSIHDRIAALFAEPSGGGDRVPEAALADVATATAKAVPAIGTQVNALALNPEMRERIIALFVGALADAPAASGLPPQAPSAPSRSPDGTPLSKQAPATAPVPNLPSTGIPPSAAQETSPPPQPRAAAPTAVQPAAPQGAPTVIPAPPQPAAAPQPATTQQASQSPAPSPIPEADAQADQTGSVPRPQPAYPIPPAASSTPSVAVPTPISAPTAEPAAEPLPLPAAASQPTLPTTTNPPAPPSPAATLPPILSDLDPARPDPTAIAPATASPVTASPIPINTGPISAAPTYTGPTYIAPPVDLPDLTGTEPAIVPSGSAASPVTGAGSAPPSPSPLTPSSLAALFAAAGEVAVPSAPTVNQPATSPVTAGPAPQDPSVPTTPISSPLITPATTATAPANATPAANGKTPTTASQPVNTGPIGIPASAAASVVEGTVDPKAETATLTAIVSGGTKLPLGGTALADAQAEYLSLNTIGNNIAANGELGGKELPAGPLPTGTELRLRVLNIQQQPIAGTPVSMAQAAIAAAGGKATIIGQILGHTPAGHPVIHSPVGDLVLQQQATLPVGANITLAVEAVDMAAAAALSMPVTPQMTALNLAQGWPTLLDLLVTLQHGPGAAASGDPADPAAIAHLAQPGSRLAAGMNAAMDAFRSGDFEKLFGPLSSALKATGGKQESVRKLRDEFTQLSMLAQERPQQDWRSFFLPIWDDGRLQQINLFYRRQRRGQAGDKDKKEDATRFVVEVNFTRLGGCQLDGLIRKKHFDLMVRSHQELPLTVKRDLAGLFAQARELGNYAGEISFQTTARFPVVPLDDIARDAPSVTA